MLRFLPAVMQPLTPTTSNGIAGTEHYHDTLHQEGKHCEKIRLKDTEEEEKTRGENSEVAINLCEGEREGRARIPQQSIH